MLPFFSPFSSGSAASHLLPDRLLAGDPHRPAAPQADLRGELARRLTDPQACCADLRDLPGPALDALPWTAWRDLARSDRDGRLPPRVAFRGCHSHTVQQALSAMPHVHACSVDDPSTPGIPIDLTQASGLQMLETSAQELWLLNLGQIPVLTRPAGMPPTFVTSAATAAPIAGDAEAQALDGLRRAIATDTCLLRLMPEAELKWRTFDARQVLFQAIDRLEGKLAPIPPDDVPQLCLLLRCVPAVLLSAPAAAVRRLWERRLRDPETLGACEKRDFLQLQGLLFDIEEVMRPRGADGTWSKRPAEAMPVLMQLQQWAWPDAQAYVRARPVPPAQHERQHVASALRKAWERKQDGKAAAAILQPGKPSPDVGLLQRMGLAPVRKLRHPVWTPPRAEGTRAPDTRP